MLCRDREAVLAAADLAADTEVDAAEASAEAVAAVLVAVVRAEALADRIIIPRILRISVDLTAVRRTLADGFGVLVTGAEAFSAV